MEQTQACNSPAIAVSPCIYLWTHQIEMDVHTQLLLLRNSISKFIVLAGRFEHDLLELTKLSTDHNALPWQLFSHYTILIQLLKTCVRALVSEFLWSLVTPVMPKDQLPEKSVASNSEIITSLPRQADPITTPQCYGSPSMMKTMVVVLMKLGPSVFLSLVITKSNLNSLFIRDLLAKLVNPGILIQSWWIHNPTEISILKTLGLEATFLML